MRVKQFNALDKAYLLVSLLLFVYVVVRAARLDITYDEAWTIFDFVPASYMHILNYSPPDTNNHILNSFGVKFFYSILPDTIFVARIPNLLGFIFFLYFGAKLCKRYLGHWLGFMCFLVLGLNPFALDFFSLARGYGLMLSMQVPALYHILTYAEHRKPRNFVYASLFLLLMILANFSGLYFFLGWMGVYLVDVFVERKIITKRLVMAFLASMVVALFIWEPIRKLIDVGGFYVGGNTGFYHDTVESLVRYSMYEMERSGLNETIALIFCVVFTVSVILAMILRSHHKKMFWFSFGILMISALATIVQHYTIGGLYLVDRTALFFYPLMVLSLFFAFKVYSPGMLSFGIALAFTLLVTLNFVSHANFYKSLLWYFDSHTTQVFDYIQKQGEKSQRVQKVDYSWPFESSFYYHFKTSSHPLVVNGRKGYTELNDSSDYYLYLGGTLDAIHYEPEKQLIVGDSRKRDTIFAFPEEKIYLFKMFRP